MCKVNIELRDAEQLGTVELFQLGFPDRNEETNSLIEVLEIFFGFIKDSVSNSPTTPEGIVTLVRGVNLAEDLLDTLLYLELGIVGDCKFGLKQSDRCLVAGRLSLISRTLSKEIARRTTKC